MFRILKFIILGVRDYIHISDLANGHALSLKKIEENPGLKVFLFKFIRISHWTG